MTDGVDEGPVPRTGVVIVAGGSGTRVGAASNKVLLPLLGEPVLAWSLRTVAPLPYVERLVVVARAQDAVAIGALVEAELADGQEAVLVPGGETRHASEWRGLRVLLPAVEAGAVEVVAVHDAARPLAGAALFEATVRAAAAHGGAVPVRPRPALVGADGARHDRLVAVQTPQAFRAVPLLAAYARADAEGFTGTDTASCVARYTDVPIHAVPAPATNLKITFPEDVALAERLLLAREPRTD